MENLLIIGIAIFILIAAVKTVVFYLSLRLREIPRGKTIVDPELVDEERCVIAFYFKSLLKDRWLDRKNILYIERLLEGYTKERKTKKYKNDAHYILSTIKHSNMIDLCILYDIEQYLDRIYDKKIKKARREEYVETTR